jgi:hypothetical protein
MSCQVSLNAALDDSTSKLRVKSLKFSTLDLNRSIIFTARRKDMTIRNFWLRYIKISYSQTKEIRMGFVAITITI